MFSSDREQKLWSWAGFATLSIFATLTIAQRFVGLLGERMVSNLFWVGMWLIGVAIVLLAIRVKANRYEIGVGVGIFAVYLLLFLRTTIAAERSHLIEYSVVAALIYAALRERRENGRPVPFLPLLAILTSTLIGTLDEVVQLFLPSRVFDPVDILFNFIASVMAVVGMVLFGWVRKRFNRG